MKEIFGNIWEQDCDWLCITTNGVVKKDGRAVMGAGIALQAKQRYSNIDKILAEKIRERGNVVSSLLKDGKKWIISFPTKNDWRNQSDIELIKQSAIDIKKHFDRMKNKPKVLIPRPGCSNGGLDWKDVKVVLEKILVNDQFVIISKGE